jgi:hypothetical protein
MARASYDGDLQGIRMEVRRAEVTDELGPPTTWSASGWLEYPDRRLSLRVKDSHVVAMNHHLE